MRTKLTGQQPSPKTKNILWRVPSYCKSFFSGCGAEATLPMAWVLTARLVHSFTSIIASYLCFTAQNWCWCVPSQLIGPCPGIGTQPVNEVRVFNAQIKESRPFSLSCCCEEETHAWGLGWSKGSTQSFGGINAHICTEDISHHFAPSCEIRRTFREHRLFLH